MKRLPMLDPLMEIRHLYFNTTRATIERDFARALDLLKTLPNEDERSRATVFMQGLAQMRHDWGLTKPQTDSAKRSGKTGSRRGSGKREMKSEE